ncbi:MAG TPA: DUF3078 domain-containing protein, partial [Prolixibacteraceae bacterium]|nr:DUF3078 domain-containing protein [Prolixibacteraceae bacterium]
MMIRKTLILLFIITSMAICPGELLAININSLIPTREQITETQNGDSLKWSVDYLNKLLYTSGEWYLTDRLYKKPIQGVLNYAENDPLDTVIIDVQKLLRDDKLGYFLDRRPQDIRNVKKLRGYITDDEIAKGVDAIRGKVLDSLNVSKIIVPEVILENALSKVPYVPEGNPEILWGTKQKELPPEFVSNLNSRINAMQFPSDMTGTAMDSVRFQLFGSYRAAYNDSVENCWRERAIFSFRSNYISEQSDLRIMAYKKSVEAHNYRILADYNDKAVGIVNDSVRIALRYLTAHAEADSSLVRLVNLNDEKTEFWTANRHMKPIRMFLKNAQNDSLSVVLISNGKGELKLVIDDGIKLTRFAETQRRTITFETKALDRKLRKVKMNKIVYPAWTLRGNGSFGFTQTSLTNWAKGGESALTLLMMSKYDANYSKDKV